MSEALKQMQARLDRLEEQLAHQSLTIDEMSGELLRLNSAHEELMRRHKALVTRLEEFEDAGPGGALNHEAHAKPPHY